MEGHLVGAGEWFLEMGVSDWLLLIVVFPAALGVLAAGLAIIIKDQARKRRGEPRPHEVWAAQRKERIEAERALIEKHRPQQGEGQVPPKRPQPPDRSQRTNRLKPPDRS